MNLIAYGDESYMVKCKIPHFVVGGWLVEQDKDVVFCSQWKAMLDFYGVKFFHFKEYADKKSHKYNKTTQYDEWDDKKHEDFLYHMAIVACDLGVPVGGCSAHSKNKPGTTFALIKHAFHLYFQGVIISSGKFADFNAQVDKINFIFDENEDPLWRKALDEEFNECKEHGHAPFGSWKYGKDVATETACLPLQAADLYTYAIRQNAERFFSDGMKAAQPRVLDFVLEKNRADVNNHVNSQHVWAEYSKKVIAHMRQWRKQHPKETYHPLIHFPYLQQT